jgi:hypothetical protein
MFQCSNKKTFVCTDNLTAKKPIKWGTFFAFARVGAGWPDGVQGLAYPHTMTAKNRHIPLLHD